MTSETPNLKKYENTSELIWFPICVNQEYLNAIYFDQQYRIFREKVSDILTIDSFRFMYIFLCPSIKHPNEFKYCISIRELISEAEGLNLFQPWYSWNEWESQIKMKKYHHISSLDYFVYSTILAEISFENNQKPRFLSTIQINWIFLVCL